MVTRAVSGFAPNSVGVLGANGALLDYETATSHSITVRTTDQGGLTFDKSFKANTTPLPWYETR